jgi:aminoglycoside phosphotransferase (APT) family kinase protein
MTDTESARLQRVCDVLGVGWSARSVRRSPDTGRWIAILAAPDRAPVVAKFATDDRGERIHALLLTIHAQCASARWIRVPEPIAYDAPSRALLTSHAPGTRLDELAPGDRLAAVERAARALRELHAFTPGDDVPWRSLMQHVADILRPDPRVVMDALPSVRATFARALRALESAAPACDAAAPAALLHRDYQLRQLFAHGSHVWVVDWDDAACGDPAFDVAYLTTYLRTHGHAEAYVDAVHGGYGESAAERLVVYECFNYLRRACRRFRLRDAGWEEEIARMIAEMERCLSAM